MVEDLRLLGRANRTVESYVTQVDGFCRYHGGQPPARLGRVDVRSYLAYRTGRVSASSVSLCVASLKFLYTVTLQRPEVVAGISYPKRSVHRLPVVLSGSEVQRLLDCTTPSNQHMIACLMYGVGLRVSEALALRASHIDSLRGVLHVKRGKGQRDRDLPLHDKLLEQLRTYWRQARPSREGYLFPGADPQRSLTADACQHAIKRAAKRAGLSRRVTPHTLRHCYATHTLQLGASLVAIQKLLGHSSILTTMRYLNLAPEMLGQVKNPFELLGGAEAAILR
jgi:site-specific recombinase XerD